MTAWYTYIARFDILCQKCGKRICKKCRNPCIGKHSRFSNLHRSKALGDQNRGHLKKLQIVVCTDRKLLIEPLDLTKRVDKGTMRLYKECLKDDKNHRDELSTTHGNMVHFVGYCLYKQLCM